MVLHLPSRNQIEHQALGQLTAIGMGAGVLSVHLAKDNELLPSSVAATKQYIYSSIIAVFLIGSQPWVYKKLAAKYPQSLISDLGAITAPAALTTVCTFLWHSLGEGTAAATPEILASTAITAALAPIGYTILHVRRILSEFGEIEIKL